jgi:hypothetical protein
MAGQAALPPCLLQLERNALRFLPCRPWALAWSEHALETAFLASEVPAAGFVAVAGACAKAELEPIRTTNADNIKVFESLIVTFPECGPHQRGSFDN